MNIKHTRGQPLENAVAPGALVVNILCGAVRAKERDGIFVTVNDYILVITQNGINHAVGLACNLTLWVSHRAMHDQLEMRRGIRWLIDNAGCSAAGVAVGVSPRIPFGIFHGCGTGREVL